MRVTASIICSLALFSFIYAFESEPKASVYADKPKPTANVTLVPVAQGFSVDSLTFYYSNPPILLAADNGFRSFDFSSIPVRELGHKDTGRVNGLVPIYNVGGQDLFVMIDGPESTIRVFDAEHANEIPNARKKVFADGLPHASDYWNSLCTWRSNKSGRSYLFLFGKKLAVQLLVRGGKRHGIKILEVQTFAIPIAGWYCAASSTGKVFFSDRDNLYSFQAAESTHAPKFEEQRLSESDEILGLAIYRSTTVDYLFVSDYGINVYDEKLQHQGSIELGEDYGSPLAILQTSSPDFPSGAIAMELYDLMPSSDAILNEPMYNDATGVAIGSLGNVLSTLGIDLNTNYNPKDIPCHPCRKTIPKVCSRHGFAPEQNNCPISDNSSTCQCLPGFTGQYCNKAVCPHKCSKHGTCLGSNTCKCNKGWTGPHCSTLEVKSKYVTDSHGRDGDTPTIWLSSSSPDQSRIVTITNSAMGEGLNVFDLKGTLLQHYPYGWSPYESPPYKVEVVYNVLVGNRKLDLLFAICEIQPCLFEISSSGIAERIECSYHPKAYGDSFPFSELSSMEGTQYVYINSDNSCTEYKINSTMNGTLQTYKTRSFSPESEDGYVEGCVADEGTGFLYIVEKDVGLWRYDLKLDEPRVEHLIAHVGDGKFLEDPKGITLIPGKDEDLGYIFVSHPAIGVITVYERASPNKYFMSFSISQYWRTRKDRSVGKEHGYPEDFGTFGIAATGSKLNEDFPYGLLVAQDNLNDLPFSRALERTSFKLVSLSNILGEERAKSLGCA